MKKFAFLGVFPQTGGVYAVFLNLRSGLEKEGVELRWVVAGRKHARLATAQRSVTGRSCGDIVAPHLTDELEIAKKLSKHLLENYDVAIINTQVCSLYCNLMRYMHPAFKRIQLVHTITIATYKAAASIRNHVHATVCVSPRIAEDLIRRHGFSPDTCVSIPNAVRDDFFTPRDIRNSDKTTLNIIALGRIDNSSKGVFYLPSLLKELGDVDAHLTLAGDGPDLPELKRRCRRFNDKITFLGKVPYENVADTLALAHVFIFPSRYEGSPVTLAEAMAVGCVPVASRIYKVTEAIVDHDTTGYLFEIGNMREAANYIKLLANSRHKLKAMSEAAIAVSRKKFSVICAAQQYMRIINQIQDNPSVLNKTLDIDRWRYPIGLQPGIIRRFLPENIKVWLRRIREKLAFVLR